MPTIRTSILDYWVHTIIQHLREKAEAHFKNQIDRLIGRHDAHQLQLGNERYSGFIHGGLVFRTQEKPETWYEHLPALSADFIPDMDRLLTQRGSEESDFRKIRQALVLLLQPCNNDYQDARDALPEFINEMFPKGEMTSRPRLKPELHTIQDSPAKLRVWEKALEKIQFYSAMRLIYQ